VKNKRGAWIVALFIGFSLFGCSSVKHFSTTSTIELQTAPPNILKAAEKVCDSMGFSLSGRSERSIGCAYHNSWFQEAFADISKEANLLISAETDKSLSIDISVGGIWGYGDESKANAIIAEFGKKLVEKSKSAKQ
jgi:hypothetical protein